MGEGPLQPQEAIPDAADPAVKTIGDGIRDIPEGAPYPGDASTGQAEDGDAVVRTQDLHELGAWKCSSCSGYDPTGKLTGISGGRPVRT